MSKDDDLRRRAGQVMPAGVYGHMSTRLLPDAYPQFMSRAEGAYVWDVDGNRYLDFMCAYGPNLLGYREPTVEAAIAAQRAVGDVMTGPSAVMVELCETLVGMIGHADWAMLCKNGTDATTLAMTVSRAHSGKRKILVAEGAYHGAAPWCTPFPAGVLPEDRAHIIKYIWNDIPSLEAAVREAGDDLAGIFASPVKHDAFVDQLLPDPAYARRARQICDETGALLIVDDVRAGFRLARDCSWSLVGVEPDLSAWGKCFANGLPISALLGSDKCREGAASVFATGSFWFGAVPMAAALATLRIVRESDYLEHSVALGERLRAGVGEAAARHGFAIRQTGPVQMPQILFEGDADFRVGFGWGERMVKRGFYLHPWHNMFLCAAMTTADIDATIEAADAAFGELRLDMAELRPHAALLEVLGRA